MMESDGVRGVLRDGEYKVLPFSLLRFAKAVLSSPTSSDTPEEQYMSRFFLHLAQSLPRQSRTLQSTSASSIIPSTILHFKSSKSTTKTRMASNTAAWLTAPKSKPFEVKSAPLWTPAENEILIRNYAVAINPIDDSLQFFAWWPLNYPTILGHDVAGEVVAVGPNVTRFKQGARVLGDAVGMMTKRNQDNAFQQSRRPMVHRQPLN